MARRFVAAASGLALLAVPAFSVALRELWPALGPPLADQRLAAIRGGFTAASGAQFSFGIQRTVTINGEMVAITRLVLDNLQNLMQGTMPTAQFATTLGTVIQSTPGTARRQRYGRGEHSDRRQPTRSPPAPAPRRRRAPHSRPRRSRYRGWPIRPAAAPAPAAAAAPAPATAAAPVQTVQPATPASPTTSAAAAQPLVVQMTVNGQVIQIPNGAAIGLAVQNSLNNQQISARTQIDATLSSLSALQSGQFAAALRQQAIDSVRR
jgi:hypothetical protein